MKPATRRWILLVCALAPTCIAPVAKGQDVYKQTSGGTPEPAIALIANNLAEALRNAKAKSVVVFDLTTSNREQHPVGKWIADQLSLAISKQNPKITMIDRSQIARSIEKTAAPTDDDLAFKEKMDQARRLGADVAIDGNFAAVSGKIGISLDIIKMSELEKTHVIRTGVIPLSAEIAQLAPAAVPGWELEEGVPRAGKGGISMPICTYCVPPSHVPGQSGTVKLEMVVTEAGRPQKIKVVKSPSHDLQEVAIRAVRQWRFKPATDLEGRPIAVVVPIEIFSH